MYTEETCFLYNIIRDVLTTWRLCAELESRCRFHFFVYYISEVSNIQTRLKYMNISGSALLNAVPSPVKKEERLSRLESIS
jgi:hypothetical protein